jgi:hypothetical protein
MGGGHNSGVWNPRNLGLYAYTYNSPISMKDPDGERVFLVNQEADLRHRLFEAISALTDDSLRVAAGTHEVTTSRRVNGGVHPLGTLLVRLLIDSDRTVGILWSGRTSIAEPTNRADAAPVGTNAPTDSGGLVAGTGRGSDVGVVIGSNARDPMAVRDSDGIVRNRPGSIVTSLAHELVHALDIILGQLDPTEVNHTYEVRPGVSVTERQRRRELRATGLQEDVSNAPRRPIRHGAINQNSIAREQGLPIREAYEQAPADISPPASR